MALHELSNILPLPDVELNHLLSYVDTLPKEEAAHHLQDLLGDSPESRQFISSYTQRRADQSKSKDADAVPPYSDPKQTSPVDTNRDVKSSSGSKTGNGLPSAPPPTYSSGPSSSVVRRVHTNVVIEAANIRARDEQDMQQALQNLQYQYNIYNPEIEPEHETEYSCFCPICQYKIRKYRRKGVQDAWSRAVMYPGEVAYSDAYYNQGPRLFTRNPYLNRVVSPFGWYQNQWGPQRPSPSYHAQSIHQTIELNNALNRQAQDSIDAQEPKHDIWDDRSLEAAVSKLTIGDQKRPVATPSDAKRSSIADSPDGSQSGGKPKSKLSSLRKSIGIKSSEEKQASKLDKIHRNGQTLRNEITAEESGRWPDEQWRQIVASYQDKVGMTNKIRDLRTRHPIQYLHLLRAGYFEPIPVAWATQASNVLKFNVEAAAGWRGVTPVWRGYEDLSEERLYWVLNHREGNLATRMKPDRISELNMATARMARAVEPPPLYFSDNDVCHIQHTSAGYTKQVMPAPLQAYDRPESPTDDTMILLDTSGSMDFDPVRPVYDQYLITKYVRSTQPKNKDVAKAIVRRFVDAMANHDHQFGGYDLVSFASQANYIGKVNHQTLDRKWNDVRLGGGTRVMTGWQKVKEIHFQKHSESATYHPVYGWQAGPQTPMLRLLLLLDGEAQDMDEFELDLLGLSWAHVTIFLVGVDQCLGHLRHANELQRISDVNHHVSFVDAWGSIPERFVTHELLKRHLGYDVSMQEFEELEQLPPYSE